jgi:hypothetical protein
VTDPARIAQIAKEYCDALEAQAQEWWPGFKATAEHRAQAWDAIERHHEAAAAIRELPAIQTADDLLDAIDG